MSAFARMEGQVMTVGIGNRETVIQGRRALTVTRGTLAAWTRMAICTGMEIGLFQEVTATAADATTDKLEPALRWVARAEAEDDFNLDR